MKRIVGFVLAGLGVFLLVLAAMLKLYVVPNLAKAPLVPGEDNADRVSVSVNEGTGTLFDVAGSLAAGELTFNENVPLVSTRVTRGDVQASEAEGNNIAVYDSFSRLTDPEETVLSAGTIRVAFDRTSSELSECCGANVDGDEVPFAGINPLKFPFFVEKKSYDYYDTTLLKAIPIDYVGEEELFGLNTYVFSQSIPPTQYTELEVPGSLLGSDEGTVTGGRFYANDRMLWVDPVTGAIIKGQEDQKQTFQVDGVERIALVQASVGGTDEAVQKTVDETQSQSNLLGLMNSTVPLVAVILGILALVGGLLLSRGSRDEDVVPVEDQWSEVPAP